MPLEVGICEQVRRLRQGALEYWRPLYEARREERAFLDGDRYVNNTRYNKDRRVQQFRGQELSNVNRHKAAQATSVPRSLEALPVDSSSDPHDAEIAVSIMEWELSHPQKGFDDVLEEVVQDAIDCRAGCAMLEYDPDLGSYGETYWRWKDSNLVMFEPGHSDPHHLTCRWMQVLVRMHVDDLKRMSKLKGKARWKVPDTITADGEALRISDRREGGADTIRLDAWDVSGVPGPEMDDEHIWVLYCWYKNDPSYYERDGGSGELKPGDRYMGCNSVGCNFRSDTQDQLKSAGKIEGDLPDALEEGCPECGGDLGRRDVRVVDEQVLVYHKGRRLVIQPYLQRTPDDEPFYDGGWPVPSSRSFPILWVTSYVSPGRPMGDSDTTRNWESQVASDQLLTMAFDRITRHQFYYAMPQKGIYDHAGQRFEFRDDQYNVMFVDQSDPNNPAPRVEMFQGASLDPAWNMYWQAVQAVLTGHQGISDLGITQENSKDIAASTVAQLTKQGEIPLEHFVRRKNRALGKAYGVHWDYLRETYTPQRLTRLKIEDEMVMAKLWGDELANFDFVVSESPPFAGLEKAKAEAFQAILGLIQQIASGAMPPEAIDVFADINRLPPSIVRKAKKLLPPPAPASPTPGMGNGSPDEMASAIGGFNPMELVQQQASPEQALAAGAA